MKTRLLLTVFVAMFCVYFCEAAAPGAKEFAVAINQAGRQRMLSQKMTKEFLAICAKQEVEANRTELGKTIKLFDTTLTRLQQGDAEVSVPPPPTPEIAAQLETVKGIWGPFRKGAEAALAPGAVPPEAVSFVARENVRLLGETDKAVGLYEKASQAAGIKGTGAMVNVAGRQRMLTQRMSKNILLISLEVEAPAARIDLKNARDLFEKSLKGLAEGNAEMNLPGTANKVIQQQLRQVGESWERFKGLIDTVLGAGAAPSAEVLQQMLELNPKVLADCQKVVSSLETETY